MENKIISLSGQELKVEQKEQKDYSGIKISDVYKPKNFHVVIEEPFNFTQLLHKAQLMKDPTAEMNMDLVFTVVAVGDQVSNCKIGDKVLVQGRGMPVNLVSEFQSEISEDLIAGVVINEEYEQIRRFFSNQRSKKNPALGLNLNPMSLGYDKKVQIHGDFNPHTDLPN